MNELTKQLGSAMGVIAGRLLVSLGVLFVVVSLTFLLCRVAPGNPFSGEKKLSPEVKLQLEKEFDLNGSLATQYAEYMANLVQGNLGYATAYRGESVNYIIAQTLPVSVILGSIAYVIALVVGTGIGIYAALNHGRWGDRGAMGLSMIGISTPNFVSAPLLILLLCIDLNLLPVAGWGDWDQLVLPALCLSIPYIAAVARLVRGSLLEVLGLDFIRTARSKGLTEAQIVFRHALKVAILPLISFSGPAVAGVLTGSIVIEAVFGIPGIGQFFVKSISNRDPFLTSGVVLVYGCFLVAFNALADVLTVLVDRRIKMS